MRKPYPTDLTEEQWQLLAPILPPAKGRGRPRADLRAVLNAIFYICQAGCAWRLLPTSFPPWQTVYGYFNRFKQSGLWHDLNAALCQPVRLEAGRKSEPSAASIDSQSIKCAAPTGARGYDGGKKIKGRKRHRLVDVLGLVLTASVTAANIQDRDAAQVLLPPVKASLPRLKLIWADSGYSGPLVDWVRARCGWVLEIVKRAEGLTGFHLLPKRWIVEIV